MGLNPLFVPPRALDAGAAFHSELAASLTRCQLRQQRQIIAAAATLVKTIDAMLDERPGRGGEEARVSSHATPVRDARTKAVLRCPLQLFELSGQVRPTGRI
jgi:hypothetical protein